MSNRLLWGTVFAALWGASPGQASAGVIVTADTSTIYTTNGVTGAATTGGDMAGMRVTAFFANGTSESVTWTVTTPMIAGQATGTNWQLAESDDTISNPWTLSNFTGNALTRLVLDGAPGRTLFDRTSPAPGTPGSGPGFDYRVLTGLGSDDILATYRGVVAVPPAAPVGDLFSTLDLQWTSAGGFGGGRTQTFMQDTDSGASAVVAAAVPEPAGLAVFGLFAAAGVFGYRRRA